MFAAITTKFLGPTDHRGARILAKSESLGKVTIPYDYALSTYDIHASAAQALINKAGWEGTPFMLEGTPFMLESTSTGYIFTVIEK